MADALTEAAMRFAVLKAAKEQKEREVELINKALTELGEKLFELFADSGAAQLRLSGADIFTDGQDRFVKPESKYSVSVVNAPAYFDLLRAEGHGAIIKETVHHTATEKWVKEKKEQNVSLPPEDVLKVWTVNGAKVTRAPKRAERE